ncbi:uracil-DNA glycosylase [Nocardioides bruguierae]|uniref:uracil-DNA glycosylase n=1 Tax=Nocardioides bruguierae TaxID=2945102 RepID=UPI002021A0D4|nr:uracil-DNA glycosylase [Nocardioides bruguierae]MCL8026011.1 uracil-DNA glycosylase [Nocardioides bruguierae]
MASPEELEWALGYNAYERLAEPRELQRLLAPAMAEFDSDGRVPGWCGVDLLRAWAFWRVREAHHAGDGQLGRDWEPVLQALRQHASVREEERPPPVGGWLPRDWADRLQSQLPALLWPQLVSFLYAERRAHDVVPAESAVFRALELTSFADIRVVIVGQDPYPTPGDADGLAFSTTSDTRPPALRNIFKELAADTGLPAPTGSSLEGWARQGVLLLNTALTLRTGSDADRAVHRDWKGDNGGWQAFTDSVIRAVAAKPEHVVFVLWGSHAHGKAELVEGTGHTVLRSAHPTSYPSATVPFAGSRPFTRTNKALSAHGRGEIDWAGSL